jgi:hypothetical protein
MFPASLAEPCECVRARSELCVNARRGLWEMIAREREEASIMGERRSLLPSLASDINCTNQGMGKWGIERQLEKSCIMLYRSVLT